MLDALNYDDLGNLLKKNNVDYFCVLHLKYNPDLFSHCDHKTTQWPSVCKGLKVKIKYSRVYSNSTELSWQGYEGFMTWRAGRNAGWLRVKLLKDNTSKVNDFYVENPGYCNPVTQLTTCPTPHNHQFLPNVLIFQLDLYILSYQFRLTWVLVTWNLAKRGVRPCVFQN